MSGPYTAAKKAALCGQPFAYYAFVFAGRLNSTSIKKMQPKPRASHSVKRRAQHQGADNSRRDRLGKAVQAGLLRADERHTRHIQAERQHIAQHHDRENTEHAHRRRHIIHRPGAEDQGKHRAAHQERPALQHRGGVLLLQFLGPHRIDGDAAGADNARQPAPPG